MNQLKAIDSDDHSIVDHAESPGQRLRAQRQSRGVEIERIAAQLHLRKDVVEALEQDRYETLPAPVYVAGYLRNYARLIGLDPILIVNAYHAALPLTDVRMTSATSSPRPRRDDLPPKLLKRLIMLLMTGAVIGLLVLGWQNRSEFSSGIFHSVLGEQPPAAEEDQTLADAPTTLDINAPEQTQEPVAIGQPMSMAVELSDDEPMNLASSALPSALASAPAASAVNRSPTGKTDEESTTDAEVVLEFTGSSWISVMGANGNVVLNGEMREGDHHVLKGQPPYKFVIGNATATRMSVGGQPFDVVAHSHGNVARFSFDPANPQ
jgi:cytoskeleton protein RodZ